MLLENNMELFKNPTVGIFNVGKYQYFLPECAAVYLKHNMFASCADRIFAQELFSLFLCSLSSSQYTQVTLGTAFIKMQGYTCQKCSFLKFPH